LLPIGGVAQLAKIPEKPVEEFVIAIAGPLVNFLLAIVLALVGLSLGYGRDMASLSSLVPGMLSLSPASLFTYVFTSNLFLALFNLLPAFPMDGGRVLRALLATRMPYARATALAVGIGQLLAWGLGLWGFLQGGFFLIVLAFFIYLGAGQEGQMVQLRSVLRGLTVGQAYSRGSEVLHTQATLRDAITLTLKTFQSDFPVCDGDQLVGLITHAGLIEALDKYGPDVPLQGVMLTDFEPVAPGDDLIAVQMRLAERKLDALPVVEAGRFLGLITNRDISEIYRLASSRADLLPVATRLGGE
jgi:stage IV sporulation protein FB